MSTSSLEKPSAISQASLPAHVDPSLVVDFDYLNPPGLYEHGDVYRSWGTLLAGPDIIWTPRYGGHWILIRAEDVKWVQETYQIFSHEEYIVPRGDTPWLPPLTVDPPNNIPYRAVINPSFTKKRVEDVYQPTIRALTIELIERLKRRGQCEFVDEFARVMPVSIFLGIANLPLDRRREFMEWGRGFAHKETMATYAPKIAAYLAEVLEERTRNPGEDLLSRIAGFRNSRHYKNEQELVGMAMLLFAGGLDTVASELSFAMRHLAQHPEQQRRLRSQPEIAPQAAEELLRRHGLSNSARLVVREVERKGVRFLPGDMVMVSLVCSGIDERAHENPLQVDFDRAPSQHNTFGHGPHVCVGATLARMELRVFLEEWFQRMPDVRLDPALPPRPHTHTVNGLASLNLLWDT